MSASPIDAGALRTAMADPRAGGFVCFEGWVRDLNEGRSVRRLEYEAFVRLAEKEGNRVLEEARRRFDVFDIICTHRTGRLELGEMAVWVGVSSRHRGDAFAACRYVIDEVKSRVPIWKKEHYTEGDSGWINCHRTAAAGKGNVTAVDKRGANEPIAHEPAAHHQPDSVQDSGQ